MNKIKKEYEKQLEIYLAGILPKKEEVFENWEKITELLEKLNVNQEVFFKALFYWQDKLLNRAPTLQECVEIDHKYSVEDRVRMYLAELYAGSVDIKRFTIGPNRPLPEVPDAVKYQTSAAQMKVFMRNLNLTEEEIFMKFGENSKLFFDENWLAQNEKYNKVISQLREERSARPIPYSIPTDIQKY